MPYSNVVFSKIRIAHNNFYFVYPMLHVQLMSIQMLSVRGDTCAIYVVLNKHLQNNFGVFYTITFSNKVNNYDSHYYEPRRPKVKVFPVIMLYGYPMCCMAAQLKAM